MASEDIRGVKMYLGRKFSAGGGGANIQGKQYAEGADGLKVLADDVFATASSEIVITSTSFEGGVSSGQVRFSKTLMLTAIEELLDDLGFGSTTTRQLVVHPNYAGGIATT